MIIEEVLSGRRGGVKQGGEGCELCFCAKGVKSSMRISTNSNITKFGAVKVSPQRHVCLAALGELAAGTVLPFPQHRKRAREM